MSPTTGESTTGRCLVCDMPAVHEYTLSRKGLKQPRVFFLCEMHDGHVEDLIRDSGKRRRARAEMSAFDPSAAMAERIRRVQAAGG